MSNVYIISNGTYCKIGKANNIETRLSALQVGNHSTMSVVGYINCKDSTEAFKVESNIHSMVQAKHVRGEWYNLSDDDISYIKSVYKLTDYCSTNSAKERRPKFTMIGAADTMDFLAIFNSLSKPERDLILLLRDRIYYDPLEEEYVPVVYFKPSAELPAKDVANVSRTMKSLRDKGIVCKVKAYHYMVNPDCIIPQKYTKYKHLWDSLTNPTQEVSN